MNINDLKQQTSDAIYNAGIDIITQMNALSRVYSPSRCDAIIGYIGACLEEYYRCKELILSGNTNIQYKTPIVSEEIYKN